MCGRFCLEEKEKMKVGIVTQPLYANYGGILQNFALQQVLRKMGHTPVTLDYMPSLSFGRYLLYAGKGVLCALSPSRRHPIKPYHHFLKRPSDIASFVKQHVATTSTISHYSKQILKKYGIEALIAGSDQIWRYSYNSHYIEDMYLAFAKDFPCRKIAYGASFGVENWDYPAARTAEVKELVKQFDAVSVRENSAAVLCKDNLGVEAQVVLDPTLLLPASVFEEYCYIPHSDSQSYLAAYILDINEEKKAFIEAIAGNKGLKVKDMTVSEQGISIEEWLSTIKNAGYVITDSYHGSLFSIIFRKQFQTFVNKERGADRFLTLFSKLGLTAYLLDEIPLRPTKLEDIDYSSVSIKLQQLQEGSIAFLQKSLNP